MSTSTTTPANRVGLGDAIIMGLSGSGPAQTLAVSLAGLVAVSGYSGVVPILICFIPMIGIAIAYQRLNRWDQSSGATYTWVAKVFHPYLGFLSGWMILLYYTLGTTTLTIPAGVYTIDLVAPSFIDNHWAIFSVGAAWNLLITALAIVGLKIVARFEWVIVVFQYTVLLIVAAIALTALAHGTTATKFSWTWFSWTGMGGMKGLMGGILIACFMYSGWDASIYVNEETTDRANNPGKAALASVMMLALVYSISTLAFQSVLSPNDLQAHAGDVLSAVTGRLVHKPWDSVMALAVLTATLASLQAAVVSAARVGLAMSRDSVMPRFFQRLSADTGSPWAATLTMSALNLLLLALALGTASIAVALTNAASSLGLISIVFYGITAAAALWQQRAFACAAADWTVAHLTREPRSVLALPTGQTPLGLYAQLIARSRAREVSLAAARLFNLDEYLGLPQTDPHSYAAFLHQHFIAPLNLASGQVRLLRGDAADGLTECRAYDAAIADCSGIDLCILGLGVNGHIAFNEPGAPWDLRTHVVELSDATRTTHARQAKQSWTIPTRGITMGIRTLLEARHVLLLISGTNKQAARDALHRGVADINWPVTSLLAHPHLTTIELS